MTQKCKRVEFVKHTRISKKKKITSIPPTHWATAPVCQRVSVRSVCGVWFYPSLFGSMLEILQESAATTVSEKVSVFEEGPPPFPSPTHRL